MINNPRKMALNQARKRAGYQQPMDPSMSKDYDRSNDRIKARPQTRFENPLSILYKEKNVVKDMKKKDALTQSLMKAKRPYIYSSGNLAERIKPKRSNPLYEA